MSQRTWRWISASVRGTSHLALGTVCQDTNLCTLLQAEEGVVLLAVVSDGAGSASRSSEGSKLLCDALFQQASEFFGDSGHIADLNLRLVGSWIEQFRSEIILQADSEGLSDREYACTAVAALVGPNSSAFFQIGDGAVVYSSNSSELYSLAFWPERGEYENTTFFATQSNFLEQLQFLSLPTVVHEVALFSDGIQRLALDYQSKSAHQPFFRNMFAPLRVTDEQEIPRLNEQLAAYLDSGKINQRTDDDKTLILATTVAFVASPELSAT